MTQEELDALVAEHGAIAGTTDVGPGEEPDPDYAGTMAEDTKRPIPTEKRQKKIVFKDGSTITVQKKDDGTFNVVSPLSKPSGGNTPQQDTLRTLPDGSVGLWDPKTNTFTPVTGSKLSQEEIDANKAKAIQDRNEREYNATHPGPDGKAYYLTHQELAQLQALQSKQDLDAKQIAAQIANMEADNKRLDAQLKAQAQQAGTAAQQAATADKREERLTKAAEMQATATQAANDLAAKKAQWDKEYQEGTLSLEQAKLNYEQEWNKVQAAAQAARLALDSAIAQNNAEDSSRSDATTRRGQDLQAGSAQAAAANTAASNQETARHNREAETNSQFTAASAAGQAAARIATDSLPFMAPKGTAEDLASIRNGMLSNPSHPQAGTPARSVPFPWDPMQLVQQLTAQSLSQYSAYAQNLAAQNRSTPAQPAPPILSPEQIATANTSNGVMPPGVNATSGPGSAQLATGTPGTGFQTQNIQSPFNPYDPGQIPAARPASTTISPDGTVTIEHTSPSFIAPQGDM